MKNSTWGETRNMINKELDRLSTIKTSDLEASLPDAAMEALDVDVAKWAEITKAYRDAAATGYGVWKTNNTVDEAADYSDFFNSQFLLDTRVDLDTTRADQSDWVSENAIRYIPQERYAFNVIDPYRPGGLADHDSYHSKLSRGFALTEEHLSLTHGDHMAIARADLRSLRSQNKRNADRKWREDGKRGKR